jgi:hypothetical protein
MRGRLRIGAKDRINLLDVSADVEEVSADLGWDERTLGAVVHAELEYLYQRAHALVIVLDGHVSNDHRREQYWPVPQRRER